MFVEVFVRTELVAKVSVAVYKLKSCIGKKTSGSKVSQFGPLQVVSKKESLIFNTRVRCVQCVSIQTDSTVCFDFFEAKRNRIKILFSSILKKQESV